MFSVTIDRNGYGITDLMLAQLTLYILSCIDGRFIKGNDAVTALYAGFICDTAADDLNDVDTCTVNASWAAALLSSTLYSVTPSVGRDVTSPFSISSSMISLADEIGMAKPMPSTSSPLDLALMIPTRSPLELKRPPPEFPG